MGFNVVLLQQLYARRLAIIETNLALAKAAPAPNTQDISKLEGLKQANQSSLDVLNSAVSADAHYIRCLMVVLSKVLRGGSGGNPDWNDISQDSKSDWAYVKAELAGLAKTDYGSSDLAKEGKAIIDQAQKVRRVGPPIACRVPSNRPRPP